MTTTTIPFSDAHAYDYLIVGGGTSGCVIASRLAEYLPDKKILLIEAGPSDFRDDRVLKLREWLSLLGGDLDYDYGTTKQPMGNSEIRHSRAKVLGGCSSHNTLISFRPLAHDLERWAAVLGNHARKENWNFSEVMRAVDKLRNTIQPVHSRHRNQLCKDWVDSCSTALDIPVVADWNEHVLRTRNLHQGTGFFNVAYDPDTGTRSSASVAYIHPILHGKEQRPNLTVLCNAWVSRLNVDSRSSTAVGVDMKLESGIRMTLKAKKEIILCAGAVDTPRLLLLSGIGPAKDLAVLHIPLVKDIPGVGANLLDHPETIIMWELNQPVPPDQTVMDSDAGIFLQCGVASSPDPSANASAPRTSSSSSSQSAHPPPPDLMMHCYQIPFCLHTARLGYSVPQHAFCMTPNIPRPRSRGRLYLTSSDPAVKPALDFRYFTDPEGYDAAVLVAGIRAARAVAAQAPFSGWLAREVAPGPDMTSDEDLSRYARSVAHTVYHPCGTTRMGSFEVDANGRAEDELAVVDADLHLRGIGGVRIADAGVFPEMVSVNPMVTVLAVGEICAEMIAKEAGWRGQSVDGTCQLDESVRARL